MTRSHARSRPRGTSVRPGTSPTRWIAVACYAGTALSSLVLAAIYLTRPEFMPYHADALGLGWEAVDPAAQVLVLALMRVAGGGFLAVGLATAVVAAGPFRRGETWARIALPAIVAAFYGPTLWATLAVAAQTPATPPYWGPASGLAAAAIGSALDLLDRRRERADGRSASQSS